jgi:DNA-binding XRE family transcriptional regulator
MSVWEYANNQQRVAMEEPITLDNCGEKLFLVREVSSISRLELAKILGTAESTIFRLETGRTRPTQDVINRLKGLVLIGYHKYSKMSAAEKNNIAEAIGASGGFAAGIGGAIGAVSTAGYAGLSAAGITSGLAAIGGGSMLGGLAVIAAIPAAVGLAGYGLVKGIKAICDANKLRCQEVDGQYEIAPDISN